MLFQFVNLAQTLNDVENSSGLKSYNQERIHAVSK